MTKINSAAKKLIKSSEGLRLKSYHNGPSDPWTIGWGHADTAPTPPRVHKGMTCTKAEADQWFENDLAWFAEQVDGLLTVDTTPNQFGAMVSLAYNIGVGNFKTSTCLRRFNAGNIVGAADALTWFNKSGGKVSQGLVSRRNRERDLMLSEVHAVDPLPIPDVPRSTPVKSRTLQATTVATVVSAGTAVTGAVSGLDGTAQTVIIVGAVIIFLAALFIARERLKKWAEGDR